MANAAACKAVIRGFKSHPVLQSREGAKCMETSIAPTMYDPTIAGATLLIGTEGAHDMARRLPCEEGLLVGISGSAAPHSVAVTIFPDSGDKYLSEHFWEESPAKQAGTTSQWR